MELLAGIKADAVLATTTAARVKEAWKYFILVVVVVVVVVVGELLTFYVEQKELWEEVVRKQSASSCRWILSIIARTVGDKEAMYKV